ncbi:general stress protein CsbD [Algoriphagus namhaensis]|uniref:General stress protein CsbD n=1 Tax=Algoriphagus namhaensis TaxID=915353 RepID=A0ABV8AVN2_9BACT
MDNRTIEGNLEITKAKLKQKYGELIKDDGTILDGQEDEIMGRLQKKLGKTKEAIIKEIENL